MFDTNIVIVGNVLTAPEWRRTTNTGSLVANFKVASTARRLDRESGRWVDGNSLRVRVSCWRKLAEGVAASVMVGDPIIVVGRLYTRDWTDADGNPRTMYEMEAAAVGHDLARGRSRFVRNRPTLGTSAVEDEEADARARGEATEEVAGGEAPTRYGDGLLDDDPEFGDVPAAPPAGYDPFAVVRGGGFSTTAPGDPRAGTPEDDLTPYEDAVEILDAVRPDGPGGPGEPSPDGDPGDDPDPDRADPDGPGLGEPAPEGPGAEGPGSGESGDGRRSRRPRGRAAVPA